MVDIPSFNFFCGFPKKVNYFFVFHLFKQTITTDKNEVTACVDIEVLYFRKRNNNIRITS